MANRAIATNYECFGILGQGTLSQVFEGFDHDLKRYVAIKELKEDLRAQPEAVDAFWREAAFMAGLNHAHIVRVYGVDRSRNWIIMDRMVASLEQECGSAPISELRLREILKQLLSALAYLHDHETLHGQIRLDKVLVDAQGQIKLSDLTGARIEGEFRKPDAKQLHVAPEILNPKHFGTPGLTSDLYCLGIMAVQLAAGSKFIKLFKGMDRKRQNDHLAWSMWHASNEALPPIESVCPALADDLARLINGLVRKQVGLRFASASEALQTLEVVRTPREARHDQAEVVLPATPGDTASNVVYNSPDFYSPAVTPKPASTKANWLALLQMRTKKLGQPCWTRRMQLQIAGVCLCLLLSGLMFSAAPPDTLNQTAVELKPVKADQSSQEMVDVQFRPSPKDSQMEFRTGAIKLVLTHDAALPEPEQIQFSIAGVMHNVCDLSQPTQLSRSITANLEESGEQLIPMTMRASLHRCPRCTKQL